MFLQLLKLGRNINKVRESERERELIERVKQKMYTVSWDQESGI